MNYLQALAYIESLSPTLERPSLRRIVVFMEEKGNIQDDFPALHVGGTNGKGSTIAVLDGALRAAGYRVGRFTGPHLLRWNERFHVDGRAIDDNDFASLATEIRLLSEDFGRRHQDLGPLTWFEFLTVMAFFYFARSKVDIAVFEVGLGGRFDATNLIENVLASAITNIALDHTHILGDTVEQIAFEKAGIIKEGVPLVTAADGTAFAEIKRGAEKRGSIVRHVSLTEKSGADIFAPEKSLALLGPHQRLNALVALTTLLSAGIGDLKSNSDLRSQPFATPTHPFIEAVQKGMGSLYWPGRLQYLKDKGLILDGAHNPAGAKALREALDRLFPDRNFSFVIGCFENKDAAGMLSSLVRPGEKLVLSEASTRRPTYRKELLAEIAEQLGARARTFETLAQALDEARAKRQDDDLIICTGSFATVRETMGYLGWRMVEDGVSETYSKLGLADIYK